jgi:hypothetical protein
MLSAAIVGGAAASSWIDANTIPQDLIEGIVTTFIGLLILFAIKPLLKIEPFQLKEGLGFRVSNCGLRRVVEVRVRLLRIGQGKPRETINLVYDELFEIRGNLSPLKPAWRSLLRAYTKRLSPDRSRREQAKLEIKSCKKDRGDDKDDRGHYTFLPEPGQLKEKIENLGDKDYILFQVTAKDSFTGSSRLKTKRFYRPDLDIGAK